MSIATRRGDQGETDLLFGRRVQHGKVGRGLAPLTVNVEVEIRIGAHETDYKYISSMATKYSKLDAKDYARENMRGIWAAALNPFNDDLSLNETGLRSNIRHWIDDLDIHISDFLLTDGIEVDVSSFDSLVFVYFEAEFVDGLGDILCCRSAIGSIVLDTKVGIRSARIMAG